MIAGVFDEVFGVRTHPLAVHAPVVLLPIAAIVVLGLLVRTEWRDRIRWWMTGGLVAIVAMLFVAKESGEAAEEAGFVTGPLFDGHDDLGEQTFVLAIVWAALFGALALWDRRSGQRAAASLSAAALASRRDPVTLVLSALVAVAAIVTTIWLIRTGHSGSRSRWSA